MKTVISLFVSTDTVEQPSTVFSEDVREQLGKCIKI